MTHGMAADSNGKSQLNEIKSEYDSDSVTEHHDGDNTQPYASTVCDKRFTKKWNLNALRKRNIGRKFSCTQCEKRFLYQNSLSRHMNVHEGKYRCTDCGKCCDDIHGLARHRQSHTRDKPFGRVIHGERFKHTGSLVMNRGNGGGKLYKCPICIRAFCQSEKLDIHMRVHAGERLYTLRCDKSLIQPGNLHKDKHCLQSNRVSHHCPYCKKMFKTNGVLKQHLRIHTDAKPYSCKLCSDRFMWSYQLKQHLLKWHKKGISLFYYIF